MSLWANLTTMLIHKMTTSTLAIVYSNPPISPNPIRGNKVTIMANITM